VLQSRFGVSQRFACKVVGQNRSTQRRTLVMATKDELLRNKLHEFSDEFKRWGWRKAHWYLTKDGSVINRKKIQRLWREEGLKVPYKSKKKCRRGKGDVKLKAMQMNHVWAADFQTDQTSDGRQLKFFNVVDEYTKENILQYVDRSITAVMVVELLDQIVGERGEPQFVRFDNGPEFTADAITKWCADKTTKTNFIEPGSPWQNAYIESFNGRFRDEVLDIELFDSLLEARVITKDWRIVYNTIRPHGSHRGLTPTGFALTCKDKEKETVTL